VVYFADRREAGRRLSERLRHLRGEAVVVLGLPRGGVPVAFEVAAALGAPLDVAIVRKLGAPLQPELAVGAIGEGGVCVLNDRVLRGVRVSAEELAEVAAREQDELERRSRRYHANRSPFGLAGRVVLVVDDGIASGATARAACQIARARGARRVVVAAPVVSPEAAASLRVEADEVVFLHAPSGSFSIGQYYANFEATSDEEVLALLEAATAWRDSSVPATDPPDRDEEIELSVGGIGPAGSSCRSVRTVW
jgi:putative phosphoribosyl transferase